MVFYSKDIIVTTLTTHIPLSKINIYLKRKINYLTEKRYDFEYLTNKRFF